MKKILFVCLLCLVTQLGVAQHVGLKGGLTYTTLKGDHAEDYDFRLGYTAGLLYQHHFSERVGIQTEALFTSKGAERDYTNNGLQIHETLRLNYIDIPVMLHLSSGGVFFDAGPQVSFIAKGRRLQESSASDNTTTVVKTNITDNPYAIDFGYVAGLGYRMPTGVGIELRYNGGVKNIYDEGPLTNLNLRNSTVLLMLSYLLPGR
ncbi:porin family protein [Pontibacter sp. SGAir0037]|uniref:porin family protein n=1 Tax=Pontibacter sp. SGAir0037 TaxID=2571030 RepID=UPI0010CCC38B|nr:porin family protein [Pontibacter sp. SGAir0037]QCR23139.1 PorT family protein [Pontibacter sp. SGAir0037]